MKSTDYILFIINKLPRAYIFTYNDFMDKVKSKEAIIKTLNRMAASGKILKLSKGKFYKPEPTVFGNLMPDQYQVIKDLLEKDGKITGYLTGYSIYNQLSLTTQVSNSIQVGSNNVRPAFKRGYYNISFIQQKNTITKENIPLLQLLDAIRNIKKIPDTTIEFVCIRLLAIIKEMKKKDEKKNLVRLALKYPSATRALLGAILDETGNKKITYPLKDSLNPISTYKFYRIKKALPNAEKWNIR